VCDDVGPAVVRSPRRREEASPDTSSYTLRPDTYSAAPDRIVDLLRTNVLSHPELRRTALLTPYVSRLSFRTLKSL
jgi:hypothetical protein